MNKYNIDYVGCEGNYIVYVQIDYSITAENHSEALKKASYVEEKLSKNIKVFFVAEKKEVIVYVIDNPYFTKAFITKYIVYDQEKDLEIEYSKEEFIRDLENKYDHYLKNTSQKPVFEFVAYGVAKIE